MTRKELAANNQWRDTNPTETEWVAREETPTDEPTAAELIGEFGSMRLTQEMLSRFSEPELRNHALALQADMRAIERAMLARLTAQQPRSQPPHDIASIGPGMYVRTGSGKRKRGRRA